MTDLMLMEQRGKAPAGKPAGPSSWDHQADTFALALRDQSVISFRSHLTSLSFSLVLHTSFAAAAILMAANMQPSGKKGGGEPLAIEASIIGLDDLGASHEGATEAKELHNLPPLTGNPVPLMPQTETPKEVNSMPEQALAPPAVVDDLPVPDPVKTATKPPLEEVKPSPPPPVITPFKPQTVSRLQPEKKQKKALPSDAPRELSRQNAHGTRGDGHSAASTFATSRGGTGGHSSTAGTASQSNYRSQVIAHLARHKTYPEQAQNRGITGHNAVTLTIQRDGRVLASQLASTSGDSSLDAATLAAVRRAQPFPAAPADGPQQITLTIGLRYDIK